MKLKGKFLLVSLLVLFGAPSYGEWLKCPPAANLKISDKAKPYSHTGTAYYYNNAIDPASLKIEHKKAIIRSQLLIIETAAHADQTLAEAIKEFDDDATTISSPGGGLIKCDYFTDDHTEFLDVLFQLRDMRCSHAHHTGGEGGVEEIECIPKPPAPEQPTTGQ